MTSPVGEEAAVRPFRIDVPEEDLDDLRRRIAAPRWPSKELVDSPTSTRSIGAVTSPLGKCPSSFSEEIRAAFRSLR